MTAQWPPYVQAQIDAALAIQKPALPTVRLNQAPDAPTAGRKTRQPNKTELAYLRECLGEHTFGPANGVWYEALTIRLPGGCKYTPDWIVSLPGGGLECHECKGAYRLPSHGRSRLAFDTARAMLPAWSWIWAARTAGGGWNVERYEGASNGEVTP